MRNRVIILLFFIFIAVIAITAGSRLNMERSQAAIEDSLITAMNSAQAQVMESTLSAWSKINSSFMTDEQITKELAMLLAIINPDKSTIKITKENSEETHKQTLNASAGRIYYTVGVESVKNDQGGESFVVMDVSINNSSSELTTERKKLESYFKTKKIKPNISSCVIGVYDGKLTENEMRTKISAAMSSVEAKEVEGLSADEVNSISAFSGNINNFILSNNKKVNMQIAMRYSSYDHKTYIWIGSPLIHVEY